MVKTFFVLVFALAFAAPVSAQDRFWVQIEAKRTLTEAQDRARFFAQRLNDVHGFYIGSNFYGILLGPYSEQTATATLARLLALNAIPDDSFIKTGRGLRQQFWPIGGAQPNRVTLPDDVLGTLPPLPEPPPIEEADETRGEALTSERALNRQEREALQIGLQWAGFYNAAIDGSFGPGTRAAMEAWQTANNQEATGVLTTKQRKMLIDEYNSVLDNLNLRLVRDDASGIQMRVPTNVVAYTEYSPPFVHFEASGDIPQAELHFISQAGDAGRLTGLYEIMQILDIVPPEGPRQLRTDGFTIEGIGNGIHSYTTVTLQDNEIKGFTLVWPLGDEKRRIRLLEEIAASFERLPGTLDPAIAPPGEDQSIDMVAGLTVRRPKMSHSGFYVTPTGDVATTTAAVEACTRITIDREDDAEVVFSDATLGLALLRPIDPLSPLNVAEFDTNVPRLKDKIAVAGYPYEGILNAPTLTFGQIEDIRGLNGDNKVKRLDILPQQSDTGGPVFNEAGGVVGMLLPRGADERQVLPAEVNFSLDAEQIVTVLLAQDLAPQTATIADAISPVVLTRQAVGMTVLVSCW